MRPTLRRLRAIPPTPPIVSIANATFYRDAPPNSEPSESRPPRSDDAASRPPASALFPNLTFRLDAHPPRPVAWAVLGTSSAARTAFLDVLRGRVQASPPSALSFPYLTQPSDGEGGGPARSARSPTQAIQYVGFDAERGARGLGNAYLSARYESHREAGDFTLREFLVGRTELNPADNDLREQPDAVLFDRLVGDFMLTRLLDMPVSRLSNGQTRRALIARALLCKPEVLMLNSPFMGIDPHTVEMLSSLLERSHDSRETRIILALAGDEHFPNWITNLAYILHDYRVHSIGSVDEVVESIAKNVNAIRGKSLQDVTEEDAAYIQEAGRIYESRKDPLAREGTYNPNRILWKALEGRRYRAMWDYIRGFRARLPTGPKEGEPKPVPRRHWLSRDDFPTYDTEKFTPGEPIVEMEGVKVTYGNDVILGGWGQKGNETPKEGLWWTIRRGERWGVFGPNGSGKTTLTALMMSDHPQSYSLPIKIFGKSRLPSPGQPGVSIFDLQSNIGISSPELHALFPKHLTARRVLESAWAETPLAAVTQLTAEIDQKVSSALRWFQGEICPELGDSPLYRRELLRAHGSPKPGSPRMSQIESQHMVHAFDPTYLEWADYRTFGSLPFASQRLLLFLRAIIKQPDLIVLDEAFSGMDANTVHKCHLFLSHGEGRILRLHSATHVRLRQRGLPSDLAKMGLVQIPGLSARQALVFISHRQEEVPGCIREWICLPEPGSTSDGRPAAPRFGRLGGPLEASDTRWRDIWGLPQRNVRRYRSTGCYARGAGLATEALAAAARERRAREPPEKRERRRRVERAVYRALDTRKKEARMLRDLMRVYVTPWDRAARLMGRVEYTLATAVAVMGKVEERRRAGAQQNGENSVLSGSI